MPSVKISSLRLLNSKYQATNIIKLVNILRGSTLYQFEKVVKESFGEPPYTIPISISYQTSLNR